MNPILLGIGLGSALFGSIVLSRFNRDAERDIRAKISGDHVSVRVSVNVGFRAFWGKFNSANVHASNFTCDHLPFHSDVNGSKYGEFDHLRVKLEHFTLHHLPIESLTADIRKCRFDLGYASATHHLRITQSGSGPLSVTLNLDDVKAFSLRKFPQIKDLQISSGPEGLKIAGSGNFGFFSAKFEVQGQPGVVDGTKLVLLDPHMTLNGKPMDPSAQVAFLKPFTPLVDLDRDLGSEGGIQLDSVHLIGNKLVGTGTARVPQTKSPPAPSSTIQTGS